MATLSSYRSKDSLIHGLLILLLINVTQCEDNSAKQDYFASVITLQKFIEIEKDMIAFLRGYVEAKENEVESYRSFIENIKSDHPTTEEDVEEYLSNPITAFQLIKRITSDWPKLHNLIQESPAKLEYKTEAERLLENLQLDRENELKGAVKGLLRLQKVYNISAEDLAKGQINGIDIGSELSWEECFELGANLFDQKQFSYGIPWLELTLNMLVDKFYENPMENPIEHNAKIQILEYLALSYSELNDSDEAIDYVQEILEISPNHQTKHLLDAIRKSPYKHSHAFDPRDHQNVTQNYTRLCQGIQEPTLELHHLTCTVESRGDPQFILAPLKVEHLSTDPDIKLYHGIFNDVQIEEILKEASQNGLQRSRTRNGVEPSHDRVSYTSWLYYNSPLMKSIYRLVEGITGLDMANAEPMQVANYGIGGQFEPHHDFVSVNFTSVHWPGRRLSTNLIYLSNVDQGGYTVFPHLNIYAPPIKGSLLSWYSVHRSGDPDYRSLHAGCPVLLGSKKIGTIWIHSEFQEFRFPCELENDAYKSQYYYVET